MASHELLYHYTAAEGLIGIVSTNCLWATDALYLDDAHELIGGIQLARRLLQKMCEETGDQHQRDRIKWLLDQTRDLGTPKLMSAFVCSLSAVPDSLSQWRAYCPQGGYSVGFPACQLRDAVTQQGFSLGECIYEQADHERQIKSVLDCVAMPWIREASTPLLEDNTRFGVSGGLVFELVRTAALLKHPSFYAEREYRMVSQPGPKHDPEQRHFRPKRGLIIPYTTVKLPDDIAFWGKVHVIVGPSAHPEQGRRGAYDLVRRYRGHAIAIDVSSTTFRYW